MPRIALLLVLVILLLRHQVLANTEDAINEKDVSLVHTTTGHQESRLISVLTASSTILEPSVAKTDLIPTTNYQFSTILASESAIKAEDSTKSSLGLSIINHDTPIDLSGLPLPTRVSDTTESSIQVMQQTAEHSQTSLELLNSTSEQITNPATSIKLETTITVEPARPDHSNVHTSQSESTTTLVSSISTEAVGQTESKSSTNGFDDENDFKIKTEQVLHAKPVEDITTTLQVRETEPVQTTSAQNLVPITSKAVESLTRDINQSQAETTTSIGYTEHREEFETIDPTIVETITLPDINRIVTGKVKLDVVASDDENSSTVQDMDKMANQYLSSPLLTSSTLKFNLEAVTESQSIGTEDILSSNTTTEATKTPLTTTILDIQTQQMIETLLKTTTKMEVIKNVDSTHVSSTIETTVHSEALTRATLDPILEDQSLKPTTSDMETLASQETAIKVNLEPKEEYNTSSSTSDVSTSQETTTKLKTSNLDSHQDSSAEFFEAKTSQPLNSPTSTVLLSQTVNIELTEPSATLTTLPVQYLKPKDSRPLIDQSEVEKQSDTSNQTLTKSASKSRSKIDFSVIVNEQTRLLRFYQIGDEDHLVLNQTNLELNHNSYIKYIKLIDYEVNEKLLAVFLSDYVQIWHLRNFTLKCSIRAKITSTRAVQVYLNRILILGTLDLSERKYYIEMWFIENCQLINKRVSTHMIAALELINNSSLASSHYFSNRILIWSILESLTAIKGLEASTKMIVLLESNKKLLLSSNLNGTMSLWDTNSWKLVKRLVYPNSQFIVYAKFLSSSHLLVVDSLGNINTLNYNKSSSFMPRFTLNKLGEKIIQVEQLDSSERLLIASLTGRIFIWNMKTNLIEKELSTNNSIYSFVLFKSDYYARVSNRTYDMAFNSLIKFLQYQKEKERQSKSIKQILAQQKVKKESNNVNKQQSVRLDMNQIGFIVVFIVGLVLILVLVLVLCLLIRRKKHQE